MASNEPQWGKKGNDGPPDLDELWRKINQKLTALFGGKGGGGISKGTPDFNNAGSAGVIIAILVMIWIASGFYIVNAGERGVVLRFGKYLETTQSGPRWHLPYPIETKEIVNLEQVRTVEVGYRSTVKNKVPKESLMLTDDENIIDIQFAVQYILKNPEDYLFNNRSPDDAVLQAAETAVREIVGKNRMDFVLYEGRAEISAKASKLVQDILDRYKTGINISKVSMQNAQPPEQVQAAFDDAVKAGQDRERLKSEGQAYANDVIPKARGNASRLMQEADGYKQRIVDSAEGDASRFKQILVEYNKAPGVTRERLYLDTVQQMMTSSSKVLVDQKSGGSSLLYLPLDKLMQTAGPAAVTGQESPSSKTPTSSEAAAPTVNESLSRSRDAFRSRDREARP